MHLSYQNISCLIDNDLGFFLSLDFYFVCWWAYLLEKGQKHLSEKARGLKSEVYFFLHLNSYRFAQDFSKKGSQVNRPRPPPFCQQSYSYLKSYPIQNLNIPAFHLLSLFSCFVSPCFTSFNFMSWSTSAHPWCHLLLMS